MSYPRRGRLDLSSTNEVVHREGRSRVPSNWQGGKAVHQEGSDHGGPNQYNQFDIKTNFSEETLGIIPMPVEVGSPSSLHSDEDDDANTKRMKLSDSEQDLQIRVSEYSSSGSISGQLGLLDEGAGKKGTKAGEGRSAPRTVILPAQREVLERLWQMGMKSTSRKLRTIQEQAQQETGLRMDIIHNWIHNRRRKKNQEELVNRASKEVNPDITGDHSDDSDPGQTTAELHSTASLVPPTPSQIMVINPLQPMEGHLSSMTSGPALISSIPGQLPVTVFNPAFPAMPPVVTMDAIQRPAMSVIQKPGQNQPTMKLFPEASQLSSPQTVRSFDSRRDTSRSLILQTVGCQTDPLGVREGALEPLVAKVCCSRKEVTYGDFIEVEVPMRTYTCLMVTLCQELGILKKNVLRIRKLPDVWIRRDSDVQRMINYVELEVVLKDTLPSPYNRQ